MDQKINANDRAEKAFSFVRKAVSADGIVSAFAPKKAFAGAFAV